MTIKQLDKIIDQNMEAANGGCSKAQNTILDSLDEIDRLRWEDKIRWVDMDNQDHAWRSEERNWGVER